MGDSIVYFSSKVFDGHIDTGVLTTEQAHDDRKLLDEKVALRSILDDGVTRHEIEHERLRGVLFKPKGEGPFRGMRWINMDEM